MTFILEVLGCLILAGLLALIGYMIWKSRRGGEEKSDLDEEEDVWGIGPANADELGKMAKSAAAEGRYGDAIRALYLANLILLDRKGVINFDPALTNGAFRRKLGAGFAPTLRPFDGATSTFERVHYGNEAADRPDWDSSNNQWRDVWAGLSG